MYKKEAIKQATKQAVSISEKEVMKYDTCSETACKNICFFYINV